jgi:hypothetical protein
LEIDKADFHIPTATTTTTRMIIFSSKPSRLRDTCSEGKVSQQDSSHRIYHQHCRFGIEIKLWNPDGTGGSIGPDVKKLIHYLEAARLRNKEFSGLAILFVLPGAEKWLTDLLRSSLPPTIDANEVSLHVVNSREKRVWACVPIPKDNETFQQITGFPRSRS